MGLKKLFTLLLILSIMIGCSIENTISHSIRVNDNLINIMDNERIGEEIQEVDKGIQEVDEDGKNEIVDEEALHFQTDELEENNSEDNMIESEDEVEEDKVEPQIITFKIDPLQLREGTASDEVLRIRKYLKIKGYTDKDEGYYFDWELREVVRSYQRDNGLNPDGIIGPNTFAVINEDIMANSILIDYDIYLPEEVPQGQWILINKASNTLYHYNHRQLINKYPVASGKSSEYTPEGKFYIVAKFINPYWGGAGIYKPVAGGAPNNPLGKRWLGLNIKGGGTYGIHGNSDVYSIGKYASLGCIRMFNDDIESIYDIIDYNTPVWIIKDFLDLGQELDHDILLE